MKVSGRRASRRRGAALVIVMIFSIGALVMVTTLLSMADHGARQSGELNRHRGLQAVLKVGIAAAVNEINRDASTGSYDPGTDGPGAITRATASGANDGVEVTVTTTGGATLSLGWYRTTVRPVGGKDVLTVVAAWPRFDAPVGQRILAVAEMEIEPGVPGGDFNPMHVEGPLGPGKAVFDVENNPKVYVNGVDNNPSGHVDPQSENVPGANVVDPDTLAAFKSGLVNDAGVDLFSGADPLNPGGTQTGANTITSQSSSAFNDTTLANARADYAALVDGTLDDSTKHKKVSGGVFAGASSGSGGTSINDFFGSATGTGSTYVVDGTLEIDGLVHGSGTLIVKGSLLIGPGDDFEWNGDIIIAGYDGTTHAITGEAVFTIGNGGDLEMGGNLIMLGTNTHANIDGNAGGSTLDGSLLMLTNDGGEAELKFINGADFEVEGVLVTYAQTIDVVIEGGSKATVRSLNLVNTGSASDDNKIEFTIQNGSELNLVYDNTQVLEAMEPLWDYLGVVASSSVNVNSYWERDAKAVLEDQQTQITGSATGAFGTNYGNGPWGY